MALAPKTYMCSDGSADAMERPGAIKKGQKGIPRHEIVEMEKFLASLYENTKFSAQCQSLQLKVRTRARANALTFTLLEKKNEQSRNYQTNIKQPIS